MSSADIMVSGNLALASQAMGPMLSPTPVQSSPNFTVVTGTSRGHVVAQDQQLWAPDVFSARSAKAATSASCIRAVAVAVVLALLAAALLFTCTASRAAAEETAIAMAARTEITVTAGDSLWSIAAAHPVKNLDTARTVELIRSWNGLSSSTLHVGGTLVVPDGR